MPLQTAVLDMSHSTRIALYIINLRMVSAAENTPVNIIVITIHCAVSIVLVIL